MKWFEIRMVVVSVLGLCLLLAVAVPTARADFTFGRPVDLGPGINQPRVGGTAGQQTPCISADGLELYFSRFVPGAAQDIFVARRPTVDSEWGEPVTLGPTINSSTLDWSLSISASGLSLYYTLGGPGIGRLYVTKRATKAAAWEIPTSVGGAMANEVAWGPSISPDELELYFVSQRAGGRGSFDIWVTTRATVNDEWGPPVNLGPAVNSAYADLDPVISPDGLSLFLVSRDDVGRWGTYLTRRATKNDPWEPRTYVGSILNASGYTGLECLGGISSDGSMLYVRCELRGTIWQVPIIPIVDFNGDGKVDGADLDLLIAHWGTDEPLYDIGPFPWGDGVVDEQDLKVLMESLIIPGPCASDVACDVVLNWVAPLSAESQDVYLGTSLEAVSSADRDDPQDVLVSQGQTGTMYVPQGPLDFGQTYYWRVDFMVPGPTPTIYKGPVLDFTTKPFAYPITNAVASSNGTSEANAGPENTVNGSGLTADGQHSNRAADMWLAKPPADEALSIQYEFDRAYDKVHEMLVWNHNTQWEMHMGYGLKDVTVEYSVDGEDWTMLGEVEFAQATGRSDYVANTAVDFGGVAVKYVRLAMNSAWGLFGQYGLSEVRFLYLPVQARNPSPKDQAADVSPNTALSWRAGREAVVHEVHLSTDLAAVAQGVALIDVVVDAGFDPGPLELDTTYYWKINEVNEAEAISVWEGDLWSFSTAEYLVVDDFESYTDAEGNRIYEGWRDGRNNDTNGSRVGHDISYDGTFGERTFVHSGGQSMPLAYANVGSVTLSEATLSFDAEQDWTAHGVTTLVVYFRGSPDNSAAQLYLKVNDTRVSYDGDPASLAVPVWKQWDVDLAALGAAARSVRTLTIGVSGPGSGKLYVDDIRLYRAAPASDAPVDPDTDSLVAYYAMENDVQDGSGNDRHGTMAGGCGFGPGPAGYGQALVLDGITGHVTLPIGPLVQSLRSTTIATWVDWAGGGAWQRIFDFGNNNMVYMFLTPFSGAGTLRFAITTTSNLGESMVEAPWALPTGWHHVAVTIDGDTKEMKLYLDGQLVGSRLTAILPENLGNTTQNWLGRSQWPDPYFSGSLDDFRIYSRALSEAEVRYLVGDR